MRFNLFAFPLVGDALPVPSIIPLGQNLNHRPGSGAIFPSPNMSFHDLLPESGRKRDIARFPSFTIHDSRLCYRPSLIIKVSILPFLFTFLQSSPFYAIRSEWHLFLSK
jgi:hypothetical protein